MGILSNRVQCPFAEPVPQARVASSPVRVAGSAVNEGSLCELGLLLLCLLLQSAPAAPWSHPRCSVRSPAGHAEDPNWEWERWSSFWSTRATIEEGLVWGALPNSGSISGGEMLDLFGLLFPLSLKLSLTPPPFLTVITSVRNCKGNGQSWSVYVCGS